MKKILGLIKSGTVPYADPLRAGRHPFQTYLLIMCVIASLPIIFDQPPAARSIEALLPAWVAVTWGLSLLIGSVLGLFGAYWPRKNYATALTIERIGLALVGPAAILYGVAIHLSIGEPSAIAAAIVFGFGVACVKRSWDLGKIIKRAIPGPSPVVQREDEGEAHALLRVCEEAE